MVMYVTFRMEISLKIMHNFFKLILLVSAGFELVKQNQFANICVHSEENGIPQVNHFLHLQIIL